MPPTDVDDHHISDLEQASSKNPTKYGRSSFAWIFYIFAYILQAQLKFTLLKDADTFPTRKINDILVYFSIFCWNIHGFPYGKRREQVLRFTRKSALRSASLYILIVDLLIFLVFFPVHLFQRVPSMKFVILIEIGVIILLLNFLLLFILCEYHLSPYDPYKYQSCYHEPSGEQSHYLASCFEILSSSAFKIEVSVTQDTLWSEPLRLTRRVTYKRKSWGGWDTCTCHVHFDLEIGGALRKGDLFTFIPETHSQPGAIQVDGYRSFGPERGELVMTSLYLPQRDNALVLQLKEKAVWRKEHKLTRSWQGENDWFVAGCYHE